MNKIINELNELGYDWALAFATVGELENSAACGQLAIITEYGNV